MSVIESSGGLNAHKMSRQQDLLSRLQLYRDSVKTSVGLSFRYREKALLGMMSVIISREGVNAYKTLIQTGQQDFLSQFPLQLFQFGSSWLMTQCLKWTE
jgi:hypothetical protein